jgi:hypothetical protein
MDAADKCVVIAWKPRTIKAKPYGCSLKLAALTVLNFHAGWKLATAREARLSLRLKKLEEHFFLNGFSNPKNRAERTRFIKEQT